MPKLVAKCYLNWIIFMPPSIVALGTHEYNIKITSHYKYCSKGYG